MNNSFLELIFGKKVFSIYFNDTKNYYYKTSIRSALNLITIFHHINLFVFHQNIIISIHFIITKINKKYCHCELSWMCKRRNIKKGSIGWIEEVRYWLVEIWNC